MPQILFIPTSEDMDYPFTAQVLLLELIDE